ncbi:MAG TPA: Xaa-Pro peptidase family protein [Nitrososphaerales archaeon]
MMSQTSSRVRRVFKNIKEKTPNAIMIKNSTEPHIDQSFFYFSGLDSGLFEGCALLLQPGGEITLYTSKLEQETAQRGSAELNVKVFEKKDELDLFIKDFGKDVDSLGVNSREVTYGEVENLKKLLPKVEIIDVSKPISQTRLVKDEDEISRIRKAAEVADKVMDSIPTIIKEHISESEVKAEINYLLVKNNVSLAFDTIVSFGANTAQPHYLGGERLLEKNSFALFDFGARYRRYCSDITRTFVFGASSNEQRKIYEVVKEASQIGLDSIHTGVEARSVHNNVSDFIDSKGFKGRFTHSTGHSLGLSVHDGERIHSSSDFTLEDGMVFTVEPGIYLPGFGGVRIEDDVIVRKNKCEVLTKFSKNLVEL